MSDSLRLNILFIIADEYRFPLYDKDHGMVQPIKDILGFQGDAEDIADYAKYFPGLVALRENAVVLKNHTIASSACAPSRAAIFTGQYGTRTGVTQTDGVFKDGHAADFPWLQPDGIPTLGDWFRADGYETHYFGKCHFADPPDHSLEKFGFDDWERSYPEPHGSFINNLGLYRDHGFTDLVTTFLRGKGLALDYDREEADDAGGEESDDTGQRPWLAVASFTNPHDITTYPQLLRSVDPDAPQNGPVMVPEKGALGNPPEKGTWKIELNPDGFPQNNANLPPTWGEKLNLNNKPDCQYDYSYKLGIALASTSGSKMVAENAPRLIGLPFQLTQNPKDWSTAYLQYYTYLHYVLDQHINQLLETLEETGLRKNTIVVLVTDHGEYGAAHGMMLQKWHTAYQESIHVPVVVCLPPPDAGNPSGIQKQIEELTSHIDLVPTLLGLAGVDADRRAELRAELEKNHEVPELVGADLSPIIAGSGVEVVEPDGSERQGILFVTTDTITEPLPDPDSDDEANYQIYCEAITAYQQTTNKSWAPQTSLLKDGSVCQPCNVHCVRQKNWKLVRCFDSATDGVADQWEMYELESDANESENLLVYNASEFPCAIDAPTHLTKQVIEQKAIELRQLLELLETRMLS